MKLLLILLTREPMCFLWTQGSTTPVLPNSTYQTQFCKLGCTWPRGYLQVLEVCFARGSEFHLPVPPASRLFNISACDISATANVGVSVLWDIDVVSLTTEEGTELPMSTYYLPNVCEAAKLLTQLQILYIYCHFDSPPPLSKFNNHFKYCTLWLLWLKWN